MAQPGKPGVKKKQPLIDALPGMLVSALARTDDFILTFETDPDTGKKTVHILTGRFITPCMLRKLRGQAESQRDEGSTQLSRAWRDTDPRKFNDVTDRYQ
jgi:hypothetical protein